MFEKLQTPRMQAFGAAVAIVALFGIVFYIAFSTRGISPASIVTDDKLDTPVEGEVAAGNASLTTVLKKKTILPSCKARTESREDDEDVAQIEMLYPQICDSAFDGTIEYIIDTVEKDLVARAKKDVPEFRKAVGRPDAAYMLQIEPFEIFFNDSVASALLSMYVDTGGAHGNTVFYSVNIDRTKETRITLDSLFDQQSTYLEYLSKTATNAVERSLGSDVVFKEGLAPKKENFSVFTLTDSVITFHFPPYQVAAYAAGPQKVTIPFSDLGAYWKRAQ